MVKAWTAQHACAAPDKRRSCTMESRAKRGVSGYRFTAGYRTVRPKSLMALKDKVPKDGPHSERALRRYHFELNPILRGWLATSNMPDTQRFAISIVCSAGGYGPCSAKREKLRALVSHMRIIAVA